MSEGFVKGSANLGARKYSVTVAIFTCAKSPRALSLAPILPNFYPIHILLEAPSVAVHAILALCVLEASKT